MKDVAQINEILTNHEQRIRALEDLIKVKGTPRIKKELSVKEVLLEVKPSDDIQRTATFGFFLENERGHDCFNVRDIVLCFREAREKPPKNPSDKIQKCILKGWMMEHDKKKDKLKAFVMTRTGEEVVKNRFSIKGGG